MTIDDAKRIANDKGLDVLLLSKDATPPVCKLVDYGQFRYEQQKKEKLAKKSNKSHIVKEVKLSPKISEHDYQVRIDRADKFLQKGYKVKLSCFFKGREITHPEIGMSVMNRFLGDVAEVGSPDSNISRAARQMIVMLSPKK